MRTDSGHDRCDRCGRFLKARWPYVKCNDCHEREFREFRARQRLNARIDKLLETPTP